MHGEQTVPASFTGGWFNCSFVVDSAIPQQLAARRAAYPIAWKPHEYACACAHVDARARGHERKRKHVRAHRYNATWLVPERLLLSPFIESPADNMAVALLVNGEPQQLAKAYTSRGLARPHCFTGFYWDASSLKPERQQLEYHRGSLA